MVDITSITTPAALAGLAVVTAVATNSTHTKKDSAYLEGIERQIVQEASSSVYGVDSVLARMTRGELHAALIGRGQTGEEPPSFLRQWICGGHPSAPNGHCGIVDYDGDVISAGRYIVNKLYPYWLDGSSIFNELGGGYAQ